MSENRFEEAVEYVFKHEGGYIDHPNDPGGATNYGISLRSLRQLEGASLDNWDLDGDGDVDADDMRLMTKDRARKIYFKHFWHRQLDQLESPRLAIKLFDTGVNVGPHQAGRIFQRMVSRYDSDVIVDGFVGPKTVDSANVVSGVVEYCLDDFCAEQARFYFRLVSARPSREVFLLGWLRRAYSIPT